MVTWLMAHVRENALGRVRNTPVRRGGDRFAEKDAFGPHNSQGTGGSIPTRPHIHDRSPQPELRPWIARRSYESQLMTRTQHRGS